MIFVKDVMSRTVRKVDSNATVGYAAKAMGKWKVGSLVIVEGEIPVGIITEGDVSKCVAMHMDPWKTQVSSGRKHLITVGLDERVEVAAKIMSDAGIKKLPVMDEGKLVGMVTQTDIVDSSFALVTSLKEMVKMRYRPPDFEP